MTATRQESEADGALGGCRSRFRAQKRPLGPGRAGRATGGLLSGPAGLGNRRGLTGSKLRGRLRLRLQLRHRPPARTCSSGGRVPPPTPLPSRAGRPLTVSSARPPREGAMAASRGQRGGLYERPSPTGKTVTQRSGRPSGGEALLAGLRPGYLPARACLLPRGLRGGLL